MPPTWSRWHAISCVLPETGRDDQDQVLDASGPGPGSVLNVFDAVREGRIEEELGNPDDADRSFVIFFSAIEKEQVNRSRLRLDICR